MLGGQPRPLMRFFLEAVASVCWNSGRCTGLAGAGMTISNHQTTRRSHAWRPPSRKTFVLEKHLAHRPLKIGIAADLRAALPELPSRVLARALAAYAKRIMYLQALTAGAPRVDLRRQSGRRGDRLGSRSRQLRSGQHHGFA
jgi:hypothetical protein